MQLRKHVLLFTNVTQFIVNNIYLSRTLNSNISLENLNLLDPLPETERCSKDTILLEGNITSHRAVFGIIMSARAEVYILHILL